MRGRIPWIRALGVAAVILAAAGWSPGRARAQSHPLDPLTAAEMQVTLTNNGPVTIWMDSADRA